MSALLQIAESKKRKREDEEEFPLQTVVDYGRLIELIEKHAQCSGVVFDCVLRCVKGTEKWSRNRYFLLCVFLRATVLTALGKGDLFIEAIATIVVGYPVHAQFVEFLNDAFQCLRQGFDFPKRPIRSGSLCSTLEQEAEDETFLREHPIHYFGLISGLLVTGTFKVWAYYNASKNEIIHSRDNRLFKENPLKRYKPLRIDRETPDEEIEKEIVKQGRNLKWLKKLKKLSEIGEVIRGYFESLYSQDGVADYENISEKYVFSRRVQV